jgi:hypothetical protein
MAAQGEVGSHTENHWVLGGNPPDVQKRWLRNTREDLEDILGREPRGLRPPEEQFDVATLEAWAAGGGAYVFGANDDRSASPELLAVGGDTIVLIGRFGSDDFAAAGQHRGDPDATAAVFVDDFERVRALGGAYVLSYHSQVLARPEWIGVLARATRAIAADSAVWHTTTGNIAAWWRARAAVTADVDASRRDRVLVRVRNGGPSPINSVVVRVRGVPARAPARSDARLLPADAGELRLLVPSLAAGATRTYSIGYDVPRTPRAAERAPRTTPRKHWSWRQLFSWLRF